MALYEHTFVGKQDLSDKEIDNLVEQMITKGVDRGVVCRALDEDVPSFRMASCEKVFKNDNNSVFMEFVLDDFQIEKKVPGDLEPTEFGFLLDVKKKINSLIK